MSRNQSGKKNRRQLNQAEGEHVKRPGGQQGHHVFKATGEARVAEGERLVPDETAKGRGKSVHVGFPKPHSVL